MVELQTKARLGDINNSEEPFVRKLNSTRVLTTFVGIWLRYCLKRWRLLMEMELEILLFLVVRENMLPMSLSCWRWRRMLGVGIQWHKAKQEESRWKKTKWEVWRERQQRREGEKGEIAYTDRFFSGPKYTQCYNVIHSHTHTHTHKHPQWGML
jgi:hypothetical protein